MVHDDDVGRLRRLSRPLEEAVAIADEGVLAGETVGLLGREALPGGPVGAVEAELGAVAGFRFGQPEEHPGSELGEVGVGHIGAVACRPLAEAEIVGPALEQGGAKIVLPGNCAGGDQDLA